MVFDQESYIEDKSSGEKTWLHEEHGMYMLRMWVKNSEGFEGKAEILEVCKA